MSTSRRAFIQKGSLAFAGAVFFSKDAMSFILKKEITGIQLYSVRDDMKKDPLGTLQQLAAMGYQNVEHANYINRKFYGYTAVEFKKLLGDLNLKMPSGHTVMRKQHWDAAKNDFTDEWKFTVEDAAAVGQHYVISPWLDESMRQTADDMKRYMEVFNKCGELCKRSGMKFGYHNHDFEFKVVLGDMKVFDIILQYTDPSLVILQLDIGNMYNGGAKAMDVLKKYPGRFRSMHVKSEIKSNNGREEYESCLLSTGIIPVKEIIDFGRKKGGTSEFIIEQESYQGISPLQCAKENLATMKQWGY